MDARLVEDDVREFRQPILDVLNPAAAGDLLRRQLIRLPERRFVDPIGLLQHPLAEAIGVEHLYRAAGDAVGLADQQPARLLLDDAGLDVRKLRKLGGQRQTGRSAADDENINLVRHGARCARCLNTLGGIGNLGVARLKSIQMELHEHLSRQISIWILLSMLTISMLVNDPRNLPASAETSVKDNNDMPGHLARRFQQIAVAVFLAEVEDAGFDLTPVQYAALATIKANPGLDQVTLAGLIAYDRTTITGVIDRPSRRASRSAAPPAATAARGSSKSPMKAGARCARSRRPSNLRSASCWAASARRRARN